LVRFAAVMYHIGDDLFQRESHGVEHVIGHALLSAEGAKVAQELFQLLRPVGQLECGGSHIRFRRVGKRTRAEGTRSQPPYRKARAVKSSDCGAPAAKVFTSSTTPWIMAAVGPAAARARNASSRSSPNWLRTGSIASVTPSVYRYKTSPGSNRVEQV